MWRHWRISIKDFNGYLQVILHFFVHFLRFRTCFLVGCYLFHIKDVLANVAQGVAHRSYVNPMVFIHSVNCSPIREANVLFFFFE